MRSRHVMTVSFVASLLWWTGAPLAAGNDGTALVERFLSRVDEPLRSYEGRRIMRARNERFNKEGWVEADVRFAHSEGLAYRVVAAGGSPYIVRRVLEAALAHEADIWRRGEPRRYGLTSANYDFLDATDDEEEGSGERRVAITPQRKHPLLLMGSLYLSPDGDLLRVEGRLSQSPSFWISRVDVVRRYSRIRGVRVPVELQSTAHVRIAGRSEMQAQYFYTSINGVAVDEP